jgi:hypothetical protein
MKTMVAKYPGTCFECGEPIKPGQKIKHYGRLHNEHAECAERDENAPNDGDEGERGADWRPSADALANDRRAARRGVTVARFSSGAVITQNSKGRCEDAPCCGCCT